MNPSPARFWLKIAVFLLPFAAAFALLTGTMIYLGEAMPLAWVVGLQQQGDVLYRPQYGNRDQQFKPLAVAARKPDVLALGSSRILQFRAAFFNRQPDAFYNAAAPAWRLPQVDALVRGIAPADLPDVLILALDPPWFNDAYVGDDLPSPVGDLEHALLVDRRVLQDFFGGVAFDRPGFDNATYFQRSEPGGSGALALGLRAIRDGHGFRSDGSEQYGDFLIARWLWQPQQRENHLDMMRRGDEMYVYGDTVSEPALADLDALLAYAAANDVFVIGYLPSYAPSLWREMIERGNHTYMTALAPRLDQIFERYGFGFFDFSDGASTGTIDDEFFDGWHASELSNLRLYLHMLAALPDILGPYSDIDVLRQIADSADDTWDVFGMDGTAP